MQTAATQSVVLSLMQMAILFANVARLIQLARLMTNAVMASAISQQRQVRLVLHCLRRRLWCRQKCTVNFQDTCASSADCGRLSAHNAANLRDCIGNGFECNTTIKKCAYPSNGNYYYSCQSNSECSSELEQSNDNSDCSLPQKTTVRLVHLQSQIDAESVFSLA